MAHKVTVVGVPLDENSSFLRGPALAPARIRAVLHAGAMNLTTEDGVDLGVRSDWHDSGNLEIGTGWAAITPSPFRLSALSRASTPI